MPATAAGEPAPSEAPAAPKNKKKFTPDEDRYLCYLVAMLGEHDWKSVAWRMNGRTIRQCRERFKYYLQPGLNRPAWTPFEDRLLFEKYQQYGPKWAHIAIFFRGRTDIDLKNRYHVIKRAMGGDEEPEAEALERWRKHLRIPAPPMAPEFAPPAKAPPPPLVHPPHPRRILVTNLRAGELIVGSQEREKAEPR
jgi:hypothetical protein